MAHLETNKPLNIVANAFKELAAIVKSPNPDVPLKKFSDACSLISNLFVVLEIAFQFANIDYLDKVNDLAKASSTISTLQEMVDKDIGAGVARETGSHTRNLLRVKRALEMTRFLFEEIIATNADSSLKDAVFKAYNQVFAAHHGRNLQEAAVRGMNSLPPRAMILSMINETEETAKIRMQSYVNASVPVTEYIDQLLISKNLGINW